MKVDIIIPFHGQADILGRCLAALSTGPHLDGRVFLVDDASPASARRRVQRTVDGLSLPIEWISLRGRSGFVVAVNAAWSRCRQPIAVVVNSDTVPLPDLLPKVCATLDAEERIAAVAPGSDNVADLYQYRPDSQWRRPPRAGVTVVPYLTAMYVAIRRHVIKGLLFDPVYSPGYFEDLDLSCRLRTRGWNLAVVEDCRIHHEGRATFGLEPRLASIVSRNYAIFAARWSHMQEHGDLVARLHAPGVPKEHGCEHRHGRSEGLHGPEDAPTRMV